MWQYILYSTSISTRITGSGTWINLVSSVLGTGAESLYVSTFILMTAEFCFDARLEQWVPVSTPSTALYTDTIPVPQTRLAPQPNSGRDKRNLDDRHSLVVESTIVILYIYILHFDSRQVRYPSGTGSRYHSLLYHNNIKKTGHKTKTQLSFIHSSSSCPPPPSVVKPSFNTFNRYIKNMNLYY